MNHAFAFRLLILATLFCPLQVVAQAPPFPTNPPEPGLNWATYCGGASPDAINDLAVDKLGNAYVVGTTSTVRGWLDSSAGIDSISPVNGFIAKYDPLCHRLWSRYVGGLSTDYLEASAVDWQGNLIVVGFTSSTSGIATPGAFQDTMLSRASDHISGFIVKYGTDGTKLWGTYVDGLAGAGLYDVAVDSLGNIYVTGLTASMGMATPGAFQTSINQNGLFDPNKIDGYLAKFDPEGHQLWATYLGGPDRDAISEIRVAPTGDIYLTGFASSDQLATQGVFQERFRGGTDAILAHFTSDGRRQWLTYFGGSGAEFGFTLALAQDGSIYWSGLTQSDSLTTPGAFNSNFVPHQNNNFIARFNPTGQRVWSSYYLPSTGIASLDLAGDTSFYLTGTTSLAHGLASSNVFQDSLWGGHSAYIARFDAVGNQTYATYFGGNAGTDGNCIKVGLGGFLLMAGNTTSDTNIATSGAFQETYAGATDGFLSQWDPTITALKPKATVTTLRAYPNPASSTLTVQSQATAPIQLYASDGKLVLTRDAAQGQTLRLDVSRLPAGLYHLQQGGARVRIVVP